jgi:hypothetical protein
MPVTSSAMLDDVMSLRRFDHDSQFLQGMRIAYCGHFGPGTWGTLPVSNTGDGWTGTLRAHTERDLARRGHPSSNRAALDHHSTLCEA